MKTGYKILPHINFEGTDYTIDLRLGEFRITEQPFVSIAFDSPRGQSMCECAGIVHCLNCGLWFMIPSQIDEDKARCVSCGQCSVVYQD